MKCCKCDKELDVEVNEIPPKWFGMYTVSGLVSVICYDCIKDPKNKDWGRIDFDKK